MNGPPKRVVIVGAGFAGLSAAREFERLCPHLPPTEVVVLDWNNYHLFVPLLYQVGSGGLEPGTICFPMRAMLGRGGIAPPVMFRECEVLDIDVARKKVITNRCDADYDYLIFAPGSTTNYYGIQGLEQTAHPMKTIRDAIAMHRRILESFETALLVEDVGERQKLLTFVIVGGGPTGVEIASAVATFIFKVLVRDFPPLAPQARVVLIEAADCLLNGMHPEMGRRALGRLRAQGVEVLLKCQVANVDADGVKTRDNRTIACGNVTWVAGIRPAPLAGKLPAERARDGRIIVNEVLEAKGQPGVYVAGDCAHKSQFARPGPYPQTAQVAVREGKACARNIAASILGQPQRLFDYKYKGELIFIGRNYAVGEMGGRVIYGWPAFWLYQTYYLNKLAGFKRKLTTVIDWAYDYFYRRNTAKLE